MTHLQQLVHMAVDAQARLMGINDAARVMTGPVIEAHRNLQRARLAVCAEHFAALVPANDEAFTPAPEPELA